LAKVFRNAVKARRILGKCAVGSVQLAVLSFGEYIGYILDVYWVYMGYIWLFYGFRAVWYRYSSGIVAVWMWVINTW